jgi:hypothetical protein
VVVTDYWAHPTLLEEMVVLILVVVAAAAVLIHPILDGNLPVEVMEDQVS